jgi:hypothetical protein
MLSYVLKSERAIQMNIVICRAFVRIRELIAANRDLAARVAKLETGQHRANSILDALVDEIDGIVHEVKTIQAPPPASKRKIGFAR